MFVFYKDMKFLKKEDKINEMNCIALFLGQTIKSIFNYAMLVVMIAS